MARPLRTPPQRWIEEGLTALAAGGPDAVRIEALARALGVTKGGFYTHFADRTALLDEMLDAWERIGVDEVVARVEASGGDARDRLRRLFDVVAETADLVPIEVAIREWGRRDPGIAARLERVDDRRMAYLRTQFGAFCADRDEVELRSLLTYALYVGEPLIAAPSRDGRTRALAFERLLA